MKLRKIGTDKKGVSTIVAYVLLISITIALSAIVYSWLRFYVSEDDVSECNAATNIVIRDYSCVGGSELNVTIQNKGRFTVDGFNIRVHNRTDAEFGFYILNETGISIKPGELHKARQDLENFTDLTYLEIQPFVLMDDERVVCPSESAQKISCS